MKITWRTDHVNVIEVQQKRLWYKYIMPWKLSSTISVILMRIFTLRFPKNVYLLFNNLKQLLRDHRRIPHNADTTSHLSPPPQKSRATRITLPRDERVRHNYYSRRFSQTREFARSITSSNT
ncbi:hypothetical protein NW765_004430 [Fusarium oxysporum]|nr:hypothetical protein NW765_004430 [Fusarium oxysporum]KAJ4272996.1 hypothetical protein NW764_012944 [Fusarium oxysporum]